MCVMGLEWDLAPLGLLTQLTRVSTQPGEVTGFLWLARHTEPCSVLICGATGSLRQTRPLREGIHYRALAPDTLLCSSQLFQPPGNVVRQSRVPPPPPRPPSPPPFPSSTFSFLIMRLSSSLPGNTRPDTRPTYQPSSHSVCCPNTS